MHKRFFHSLALLALLLPRLQAASKETCNPNDIERYQKMKAEKRGGAYSKDGVYQPGEFAKYIVSYKAFPSAPAKQAGYAELEVKKPVAVGRKMSNGQDITLWHQHFGAKAYTGDWFKYIFVGKYALEAFTLPKTPSVVGKAIELGGAASKFYLEENSHQIFKSKRQSKKWLDFVHNDCHSVVHVREEKPGKEEKKDVFPVDLGSADSLSAIYYVRQKAKDGIDKPFSFKVFSSKESWDLVVESEGYEKKTLFDIQYDLLKLKFSSKVGDQLSQSGDSYAWIDTKHPNHPIRMIEAKVKFGYLYLYLEEFKPGTPL